MKTTKSIRICTLLFTFALVVSLLTSCYVKIPGIVEPYVDTGDINIFFTGDIHGADDEGVALAGVKALVDAAKSYSNYVTLVDTGDAVFGDILTNDSEGEYMVKLMNDVGYQLAVPGNHEFDYGLDRLAQLVELSSATYLSCNITYTGTGESKITNIHPYAIKHYGNTKVGFVGVTTPESITSSNPQNFMENGEFVYDFAKTEDGEKFYSTVQTAIDSCKNEGANYIVLLTHLGDGEDYGIFSSDALISKISGVSAVLDGHAHSEIPCRMVADKDGTAVPLASTGTKLENVGRLVITPSGGVSVSILNGSGIAKDTAIDKSVTDANAAYEQKLAEVIATAPFALSTHIGDERVVRNRETALGNLCADAYRAAASANIAFINGGCIRASLPEGNITYGDLLALQPYGNDLSVVRATGAEIADALEFSVRNSVLGTDGEPEGESGGFLSVSGIKFRVDTSIPTSVTTDELGLFASVSGERRVKDIMVLGEDGTYVAIDLEAEYTVASVDYILEDMGDGYSMFADNEFEASPEKKDLQAVIDYLKSFEGAAVPDKYAATEGRIVIE